MLENEALQEFQAESEVGRAVQEAAQKIKKHLSRKQKKKWQQEQRDQVLAEWLEPSGITWEVHAEKQASQAAAKTASSDQEILQQIRELDEFSKWQQLKTPIKKLDLASAEALMEKFQQWKLGKSKKKPEKKAFKDLKQRIANLEKAS
jgi:DNA topoisomerase VI subunit B